MLIYHWTTFENALKSFENNVLKKRRWKHFIEEKQTLLSGTSWGFDRMKWKSNHEVCIVIDSESINNERYLINGNKVYLRTQGIINKNFDPNAWKYESDTIDECFIIGDIIDFKLAVKEILLSSPLMNEDDAFKLIKAMDS